MKRDHALALTVVALTTFIGATLSHAQDLKQGQTVESRPRPALDPLGVRLGGFLAYPKLQLDEEYNDNIFADDNDTEDDFITVINPGIDILSDWNRHSLGFYANADIGLHADNSDEDYEDFALGLKGRLDIRSNSEFSAGLEFSKRHEERDSPNDVNGEDPTDLSVLTLDTRYLYRFNRVSTALSSSFQRLNFDDVSAAGGRINNDDRDRNVIAANLRAGYEVSPRVQAFIQPGFNFRIYDDSSDDNGLDRDSDGLEIVAGTTLDLSNVVNGDVFAGYTSQDYDDSDLDTIDGFTFGTQLVWNPTGLTTVTGTITRDIQESIQARTSGYFDTRALLRVDHELRRYLLIRGRVFAGNEDFEGIRRDDDRFGAGIGAKYLLNRNLYLSLDYNYQQRDSNIANQDFNRNSVLLSLELQR